MKKTEIGSLASLAHDVETPVTSIMHLERRDGERENKQDGDVSVTFETESEGGGVDVLGLGVVLGVGGFEEIGNRKAGTGRGRGRLGLDTELRRWMVVLADPKWALVDSCHGGPG